MAESILARSLKAAALINAEYKAKGWHECAVAQDDGTVLVGWLVPDSGFVAMCQDGTETPVYQSAEEIIRERAILNLTQHIATPEQQAAGVEEPMNKAAVQALLTFTTPPSGEELIKRSVALMRIAREGGYSKAMIGGAGYLMGVLEVTLRSQGILPMHSFTQRAVVEEQQPDGSVKKTAVFRHVGFVAAE